MIQIEVRTVEGYLVECCKESNLLPNPLFQQLDLIFLFFLHSLNINVIFL